MLHTHAGDPIEGQLLGRLVTRFTVDELVATANKERIAESEETDRGSDLPHMNRIELAQLPYGWSKLFEPNIRKLYPCYDS